MYFLTHHLLPVKDLQRCFSHCNVLPRKIHVVAWKVAKLWGEVRFDKQVPNFLKRVRDIDNGGASHAYLDVRFIAVFKC